MESRLDKAVIMTLLQPDKLTLGPPMIRAVNSRPKPNEAPIFHRHSTYQFRLRTLIELSTKNGINVGGNGPIKLGERKICSASR